MGWVWIWKIPPTKCQFFQFFQFFFHAGQKKFLWAGSKRGRPLIYCGSKLSSGQIRSGRVSRTHIHFSAFPQAANYTHTHLSSHSLPITYSHFPNPNFYIINSTLCGTSPNFSWAPPCAPQKPTYTNTLPKHFSTLPYFLTHSQYTPQATFPLIPLPFHMHTILTFQSPKLPGLLSIAPPITRMYLQHTDESYFLEGLRAVTLCFKMSERLAYFFSVRLACNFCGH